MTNENNLHDLSRRKVLAGLGAIGVASAGAGLGTTAYFSDDETFENNTLTAGQLDLSVTWQQLYYGGPQATRPGDYGDAERPFVNAYPDGDGNGLQSFERDNGVHEYADLSAYDDPEEAAKAGTNLEFACAEIATFEDPSFDPNDDALIELDDVKPGDSGEVTFGIKLCDNPGYIWLNGDLVDETDGGHAESDGAQLADEIQARAWYDTNGNNVFDVGETPIIGGSLREVLTMLNEGVLLAYDPAPDLGVPDPNESTELDGITLTEDDCEVVPRNPTCEDFGLFRAIKIESEDLPTTIGESETYSTPVGDVTIAATDVGGGDLREFDFQLSGFEVSAVIVKGGADGNVCRRADSDGDGYLTAAFGDGLGAPFRTETERYGVSHISFCYDVVVPEEPPEDTPVCFEPSNTRFIALEWTLSTVVGNEVQGDSVAFDLSFYAEQCRHNPDPVSPFEAPDDAEDAEIAS
ncbi:SipW-dependent-type signal peptide-containing protein [Halopenitus sp. H-Gu1]|uniref:SipW-dependent-type signal peptide-containing protein n=1 Tax=Halopenitus sp. H-Gu1 TaxID=3242697 RepID=UPI00359D0330